MENCYNHYVWLYAGYKTYFSVGNKACVSVQYCQDNKLCYNEWTLVKNIA